MTKLSYSSLVLGTSLKIYPYNYLIKKYIFIHDKKIHLIEF